MRTYEQKVDLLKLMGIEQRSPNCVCFDRFVELLTDEQADMIQAGVGETSDEELHNIAVRLVAAMTIEQNELLGNITACGSGLSAGLAIGVIDVDGLGVVRLLSDLPGMGDADMPHRTTHPFMGGLMEEIEDPTSILDRPWNREPI